MSRRERIAVVVATHRNDPLLEPCLSSVQRMLHQPDDLIFIDNGSPDDVGGWVTHRFPGTTVVRLDRNRLFCGGYNAGIMLAMEREYDFVLILNADTEVISPLFLDKLLKVAARWPKASFIGPLVYLRLEGVVQKTCLQFPKILRNMLIWLPWRIAKDYFQTQPNIESEIEFLNGVCVLCRMSALREIGPMDENFGGYVEDADWSWRAKGKGWKSVFAPVPSIIHHESSAGYEPYSLKTFLLKRNTVLWYLKVDCRLSAFCYALAALGLAWVRMMLETTEDKRRRHRYFVDNLYRTYRGLLRGDSFGGWFGPPLATWLDSVVVDDRR